jgi:copper oxidase (laccase) domain-containing protein
MPELLTDSLIFPDWPAPARVRAVSTTRRGGVSSPPYDSLNLAGACRR